MIRSSMYLFAFARALLMPYYHRWTLRAIGLVFGGKVTMLLLARLEWLQMTALISDLQVEYNRS